MLAVVPLKGFHAGKARLEGSLSHEERVRIGRLVADHVIDAVEAASFRPLVVTAADDVEEWAHRRSIETIVESAPGLDAAATAGIARAVDRWCVIHGDLPLIGASDLSRILGHETIIAPSRDGGTNLIASSGDFPFSYGPGSFARHLAAAPTARVVVAPGLSIELDTPTDLAAIARLPEGSWLAEFLS